jgi:hypothetical protein
MFWWKKKQKAITEPELIREEIEELVAENIKFAKIYAHHGDVSGMEMALEIIMKYGRRIDKSLATDEIAEIKLEGYEKGAKLMRQSAIKLKNEGKINEANNAEMLADSYAGEALILKQTI